MPILIRSEIAGSLEVGAQLDHNSSFPDHHHWGDLVGRTEESAAIVRDHLRFGRAGCDDPLWFTVARLDDEPVGMAAMMSHDPAHRRMELGHIWYVPSAHRTGVNTEAAFLMLDEAFGRYRCRRVEWKCDSLNAPSDIRLFGSGSASTGSSATT